MAIEGDQRRWRSKAIKAKAIEGDRGESDQRRSKAIKGEGDGEDGEIL
jgi:hypothetical protein